MAEVKGPGHGFPDDGKRTIRLDGSTAVRRPVTPEEASMPKVGPEALGAVFWSIREKRDPEELVGIVKSILSDRYKAPDPSIAGGLIFDWKSPEEEIGLLSERLSLIQQAGINIEERLTPEEKRWLEQAREEIGDLQ